MELQENLIPSVGLWTLGHIGSWLHMHEIETKIEKVKIAYQSILLFIGFDTYWACSGLKQMLQAECLLVFRHKGMSLFI